MYVKISKNFQLNKLSKIEKKLARKRIVELKACNNLGEMKYGRLHPLRKRYSGAYGIRIGRMSRLLIFPILFAPDYMNTGTIKRKDFVIGIEVCYSPNHYRSIY